MKKLGAIFILLVLCALCGCSNETGTKNNTTIFSESSDTGALTSAKTTYIVGSGFWTLPAVTETEYYDRNSKIRICNFSGQTKRRQVYTDESFDRTEDRHYVI